MEKLEYTKREIKKAIDDLQEFANSDFGIITERDAKILYMMIIDYHKITIKQEEKIKLLQTENKNLRDALDHKNFDILNDLINKYKGGNKNE